MYPILFLSCRTFFFKFGIQNIGMPLPKLSHKKLFEP